MIEAGLLVFAYLLGAVPFGLLVARARGVDIMAVGSGNIGATNVWRTLGPGPGSIVMALDILKGAVPAMLGTYFLKDASWSFGFGLAAVAGHSLSPFLKFKGGKGIATGYGALMGSNWIVGMSVLTVFLVVLALSRFVSLASVFAVVTLTILGFALHLPPFVAWAYALMAAFILFKHRENIKRLMNGTERKFSTRGPSEPTEGKVEEPEDSELAEGAIDEPESPDPKP